MIVTLNLRPETQAGLEVLAHAAGQSVEDYVLSMVEGATLSAATGRLPVSPPLPDRAAGSVSLNASQGRHQAIRELAQAEAREGLYGRSPSATDPE